MHGTLYETGLTRSDGSEMSNVLVDIDQWNTPEDPSSAYYLGYIPYEDYPKCFNINTFENVGLKRVSISHVAENHPFGFCYQRDTGTGSYFKPQLYCLKKDNTHYSRSTSTDWQVMLINKTKVANINHADSVQKKMKGVLGAGVLAAAYYLFAK